jgi:4-aminobutyrate aminotransferase-like enzyme
MVQISGVAIQNARREENLRANKPAKSWRSAIVGLIIISAGTFGNVIRMLVPLVATDGQIEEGLLVLEQALAEVQAK